MPNDVTVNIRGNADQLKQELDSVGNGIPDSRTVETSPDRGGLPANDRLIDDLRNEINSQRGMSTKEAVQAVQNSERERLGNQISDKYDARRNDMQNRMSAEYDNIDRHVEIEKAKRIAMMGDAYQDPLRKKVVDQEYETLKEQEYKKIGKKYDKEEESINADEENERKTTEQALVDAIKSLTEELSSGKGGSDPNSFLNKLRQDKKDALFDRDNATTQEEAAAAQRRADLIDEQMGSALGKSGKDKGVFDKTLMGAHGMTTMVSGAVQGNIPEMMMGASMGASSLLGLGAEAAMRLNIITGIAAAVAAIGTTGYDANKGLLNLAGMRGATGGRTGAASWDWLQNAVDPTNEEYGAKFIGMGMNRDEFAAKAVRTIASRGSAEDWYNQTLQGAGMEKSLGLKEGAMAEGGKYDRYGMNVTDALAKMVTVLSSIKGSGVSNDDFTRVQEKFDIQQTLMGSYMDRADKPNYNVANHMLEAFSSVQGITQDKRVGSDIASFQGMIQSPQNDRMKALVYSSVADLFPKSQGRMDLLDRELRNPENEGKIIQSVLQRLKNQNGGTDTTLGYFTMKQLFPNIAPERLDAYQKAFTNGGDVSAILKENANVDKVGKDVTNNFKDELVEGARGLTPEPTKILSGIKEEISSIYTWLTTNKETTPPKVQGRAGH